MRTWLKRMVAGLLSAATLGGGGLLTAGTADADEIRMPDIGKTITSLTASTATTYPRELVNGGFDYLPAGGWNAISPKLNTSGGRFTSVDPVNGQYIRNAYVTDGNAAWVKWNGFDASKFGWISDQKGGKPQGFVTDHANSVELQRDNDTDNTYAEIVGSEIGKSIYQKIDTQNSTDAVYTVRFDHAALSSEHADGMQALVNGKPVTMTRIGGNKAGDKTGWTGTDIVTHATNTNHYRHDGQWATYEGKVTIPANTPVSTFTFKSLNEAKPDMGNLIDNLTFKIAYRLSYDSNSGTKAKASQISSRTEGKASETDGKVKTVADDAAGSIPSNETAGAVKQAKSKTNGSVRLAADDDVAEYAANGLPDHLVNGTFDYRGNEIINENQRVYGRHDTTYLAIISAKTGIIGNPLHSKLDNWDSGKFGWRSNDDTAGADTVEVQRRNHTPYPTNAGNVWGEIAAAKRGKYIYQDIATTPGIMYKWSLKHASRNADQDDSMQVMIGMPGAEAVQEATRTTSNGTDKVGEKSTTITTHGTAQDGRWETYTGTYIATSTTTRFTFRSVRDSNGQGLNFTAEGNCVDDLSFDKAYRIGYDSNGGAKTGASKISANADGKVRLAAAKASVPSHDLETTNVPANYRNFTFDTTNTRLSDARFDANWTTTRDEAGGNIHWPTRLGASVTLSDVGTWTDPNGTEHRISARIALKQWNGGNIGQLNKFDANGKIVGDGLFWINVVYDNKQPPASVRKTLGNIDTSKRVGCQWTVSFTYVDGTPVPSTFKGVTGFNDLDGWDVQPDLKFEGVQLLSGFDGAYKTRDAELAPYGTNGYAGIKHDAGDESNLNGAQQVRHRLAATWTGPTFTYSYDLRNPAGRADGVRMTFGMPVTRTQILTYKANGGTGQVPSRTETGRTETAASGTDGTVRLAADKSAEPESGTIADDRRVLTDTTARQDDGTSQRTITRSDGSVRVETIATTGAVSGCQVYYSAGTRITLATAKADSDCWDSSQIGKTSRTFYGWSANTDANDRDVPVGDTMDRNTLNANVRTEIVMPARAKTVYALWAINPTLSYNVNTPAGSNAPVTPASRTVPYNTAAPDTSGWQTGDTGKIPGYRFDGWYTAPNGGNKYDFNTPLTNNVTVYAHWVGNGYTVRFAGNGATGGDTPDQAFQYNIGQNLRRNGFVRDGYTFTGWKRADNQQAYGDGQWVTNLTTQPNGIVTMVAQWSANEAHIRYNPNPPAGKTTGGQGTPNWDGHTGDTPTIGQNGWTIDGYTFAGWTTSPDGSGARYAPGARWTANGTLTLYAQWTPGQASLTYDGNGATGGKTDPQNGVTDQKVNVRQNGFTRDGYVFTGWNTQPDGRGQAWAPDAVWTLHGTGVLYARWRGNQQRLNYHGNGNTGGNTESQDGRTGDVLDTRANGFTRDGYEFVEWNTRADGTGDHYGKGTNGVAKWTMLPAGNDLYAIWQANPANIQYRDDWGATGSTPDTTGVTGQNVTIAQNGFTRPGYTFTGWARDRRTNPSLQPGGRYTLTPGTTTLWAQWKADPAHLIYNSNSGSTSQTHRTDGVVDQTLTVIANPFTRPGYTFTGWNTQADGRGRAYTAGNGFRLVADPKSNPVNTSVLYAQWRINRVTLKFNPNGGTGGYPDITVDAFTTVTIPADAKEPKVQRPGFRFTGWAMKPTPGAGDTILSPGKGTVSMPDRGSITVYAQWAPAMTTLPFTGGRAQVPTIGLYAGLAFMILAMGALMPVIRLRMAAARRGRHAGGTGTAGRHAR